jgi:carboxypeptidase T
MKQLYIILALVTAQSVALFSVSLFAQTKPPVYSQLKIFLKSKEQLTQLRGAGVDFDHGNYDEATKTYTGTFLKSDAAIIQSLGIQYTVLVDDETKHFLETNKPDEFYKYKEPFSYPGNAVAARLPFQTCTTNWGTGSWVTPTAFTPGTMGGYYTFNEMVGKLDEMVAGYPGLVSKFSIGTSLNGNNIWCIKISDNAAADEPEPEVLYTGLHHAREPMSMHNLIFFMQYILQNYNTDSRIAGIINNRQLFFIPCVNPDGYTYNATINPNGGGMHRKNRRDFGAAQTNKGVDLNRNYGVGFGYDNVGSSPNENSDTYRGPSAFSETETQAIRTFVNSRRLGLSMHHHAFGQLWVRPYSLPTINATLTEDTILNTTGSLFTKYNCFKVGDDLATVGYQTNGVSDDWFMAGDAGSRPAGFEKIYTFTPEVGQTFWPSSSLIIPIAREMMFSNLQTAYTAGQYFEVEDNTGPAITSLTGNFTYRLTRAGMANKAATVELVPLQNILSVGAPVTISSISNYGGVATGSISYNLSAATPNAQVIKFVWKVTSDNMVFTDTVTKVYNPFPFFADDMEGNYSDNWVSGGTGSAWGFSVIGAFSGSKSMTESPTGNYPGSSNWTSTCNKTFDLLGCTEAFLSFWIKSNSENCYDVLRVEVSNNNGVSYVPVCGTNTVTETRFALGNQPSYTGLSNGWRREIVNLNNYIGSTNLRFRFSFVSNATNAADGFYIDDVTLLTGTLSSPLSAGFLKLSASVVNNHAVQLEWESNIGADHSYFVIERSANGAAYNEIGRTTERNSLLLYKDESPAKGKNIYRIKAVNNTGKLTYSNPASIKLGNDFWLSIHPNPATDFIQLNASGLREYKNLQFRLTDVSGRTVYTEVLQTVNGDANRRVNVKNFTPGMYLFTLVNDQGAIVHQQKIMIQ